MYDVLANCTIRTERATAVIYSHTIMTVSAAVLVCSDSCLCIIQLLELFASNSVLVLLLKYYSSIGCSTHLQ
jgi:hypothetical protein